MSAVDARDYGIASSTVATMRLLGQMVSMALVLLLIALFVGHAPITEANLHAFMRCTRTAFAVFAALCFLGVFASAVRNQVGRAPAGR